MIEKKLQLIDELTSPLCRIVWAHNSNDPVGKYANQIMAFHIGSGLVLSVAHNLKLNAPYVKSIPDALFQTALTSLNAQDKQLVTNGYPLHQQTATRNLSVNAGNVQDVIKTFAKSSFDARWITLDQVNTAKPLMAVQFRQNSFFNSGSVNGFFGNHNSLDEPQFGLHTFFLKLELVEAFYSNDIALYRIVETPQEVIAILPRIELNNVVVDDTAVNVICLQSSALNDSGRLLNAAKIEGHVDTAGAFADGSNATYVLTGLVSNSRLL
ncbi:MAG: hypothetical protein WKF87_06525 [Chryseolinea sp.]